MERILSKEEIAELLSAVRDGSLASELDAEETFDEPQRAVSGFSLVKNSAQTGMRLVNFDLLLDAFARNLSFAMSSKLQRTVSVTRENIGSMDYESLIRECGSNQLFGIISLTPLKKNGLLILDPSISFPQVEILLGGGVGDQEFVVPKRSMTSIELNIIKEVIRESCPELNKAFATVEKLSSELERVETNPRLVTIVPGDTEMMVAAFAVKIGQSSGSLRLVIPYSSLDPLREKLKSELGARGPAGQWARYFNEQIEQMDVSVAAQLAQIQLSVRDILDLRVGDVLPLDCAPDSEVKLQVEGRSKFLGLVGLCDGAKALRIVRRLEQRR